ncbi:MAG: hypothetical protein AAGI53_09305 [Planctomycetota bacterium]
MALLHEVDGGLIGRDEFIARGITRATVDPTAFKPIGIGLPLTISMRHFYTGREPRTDWLGWGDKDMLLTSASKATTEFEPAARAINLIRNNVPRRSPVSTISATEAGTPIIYHSPAMVEQSVVVSFEAFFDNFPKDLVKSLSSLVQAAAGIPLFAGANAVLSAAGIALDLAAELGEAIFDGDALFAPSAEEINFLKPGVPPTQAGYLLLVSDRDEAEFTHECTLDLSGRAVLRGTDQPYTGDVPYVTLAVDGHVRPDLKEFQATRAAGDRVNRFLGNKEDSKSVGDTIIDGLKLANDLAFRRRADSLDPQILNASGDEKARLEKLKAALLKNISNDLLKPGT